jgi:SAM-dependent methyltransferase
VSSTAIPPALTPYVGADIYLLDQILRRRICGGMHALDIACGGGRNLPALLAIGCRVTAVDVDAQAVHASSQRLQAAGASAQLVQAEVAALPFAAGGYDLVLVNALLHFAPDGPTFHRWADACWQQRASSGLMLARFSTRIGLPAARPPGFGYLATAEDLAACEARWGARRLDPLKTTLVEELRTMSTWVLG